MCPYISDKRREALSTGHQMMGAGDLTYRLQQQLEEFLETKGLSYQTIAECLGALEGAKFDLLERVAKPYEQRKLQENGDVWPEYLTDHGTALTTFGHHPHLEDEVAETTGVPERGPAETSV